MYAHALQTPAPLRVTVGRAAAQGGPDGSTADRDEAAGIGTEQTLHQPFAVLGRAKQCDLWLPDQTVSLRHLLLHGFRDRVFAMDLFSANGCRHDGDRFRAGWLPAGESIAAGPFEIAAAVTAEGVPESVLSEEPPSPLEFKPRKAESEFYGTLPEVRLEVVKGASSKSGERPKWPINRIITLLGRSDKCRITCGDASVSGVHCAFVLTPAGLWVFDVITRTGIRINGDDARCGLLSEGHELEVGHYVLRAVYDRPPAPPPQPVSSGKAPNVAFATKNHRVFRTEPSAPVLVVKPQGDLQEFRYQEVQLEANAVIAALGSPEYPHVVVDFSEVKLIGSVMLESVAGICRAAKGKAAFCSAGPEMYQALVDTNLQRLWFHYNSREDAVAATMFPT